MNIKCSLNPQSEWSHFLSRGTTGALTSNNNFTFRGELTFSHLWLVWQLWFSSALSRQGSSQISPFTSKSSLVWQSHHFCDCFWNLSETRNVQGLAFLWVRILGLGWGRWEQWRILSHSCWLVYRGKACFASPRAALWPDSCLLHIKSVPVSSCPFLWAHEVEYWGSQRFVLFL